MSARDSVLDLKARMGRAIIGQEAVIDRLLLALLADGNVLMEGLPGLAKTRAIKSLARNLEADFSRIQFTPDLLPSDVTGAEVYVQEGGTGEFRFSPGPLFGNLILADEINRSPAKVQAALLEAMEERQVTVAGQRHRLPELFMVLATQNPIEQEGTYPLPEAQMDRFLLHVLIHPPEDAAELEIMRLVRREQGTGEDGPGDLMPQQAIFDARREIHEVRIEEAVEKYIVAIIGATRHPERFGEDLAKWIEIGASPRGTIALDRVSRARAWMEGRDYVTPDDVRELVGDALRHRVKVSYDARADGLSSEDVIGQIIRRVAVA